LFLQHYGLLQQQRLRLHPFACALVGLFGTLALIAGRTKLGLAEADTPGFAAAFVAAFVWATYSVLSRKFANVPTDVVAAFCLAAGALSAICHAAFEETVWPADAREWLATIGLGLGPVGLAFYA